MICQLSLSKCLTRFCPFYTKLWKSKNNKLVKNEETILTNDNGVLISNSQVIEDSIINAKGAPYKKAKRSYETSQKYLFVTYDEVTIDTKNWTSIHGYRVKFWFKVPILIFVERVTKGANANHCTMVIMEVVQFKGGFGHCHKTNNIWCTSSWSCSSLIFMFQFMLSYCIYSCMFIFCLH